MARLTTEEFLRRSREAHGGRYDYSQAVYVNVKTKVRIVCPEHGGFDQAPEQHMMGHGCPKCALRKRQQTMRERHGVDSPMQSEEILQKSRQTRQRKFGQMKPPGSGRKALGTESFIKRSREIHGDKYDYSKVEYVNNSTKVRIVCPAHGEFEQTPAKHLIGRGCPHRDCIAAKKRETNMFRYGVPYANQSEEVKDRMAVASMEKHARL